LSPFGNTIASQGFVMNLGLNLARFISKNIVLGINSDLKLSGGYFIKYGTSQFLNDFNSSFYLHYNNSLDSANSNIVRNAINKSPLNPITGSRLYNFGIMFSPFPFKYGGIMLQVRRGAKVFKIDVGNNPFVGGDNGYLEITKNWIYELMFKPLTFKKNKFPSTRHFNTSITFSVHYEKLNFGNAKFNGTSIRQMLSSDFINRYQFDNRFGFKIGLGFY
jgi:hypothetical protein